jgi:DNA primase catalytic core, N-terminal domain
MVKVNQLSLAYFRRHLPSSWAQQYLADRFGADITNDIRFQPGHAPAGWTNLVDHLRRHGATDQEMMITGAAVTASTGRLIDRFRDRVVFPIIHDGQILGFVGRRRPDLADADRAGPKYRASCTALSRAAFLARDGNRCQIRGSPLDRRWDGRRSFSKVKREGRAVHLRTSCLPGGEALIRVAKL